MNIQPINKHRIFILLAAALGIFSVFLPWTIIGLKALNGFRGYGIAALCAFIIAIGACFLNNKKKFDRSLWLIEMAAGISTMAFIIIFLLNIYKANKAVKTGIGIWLSLFASIAVIVISWLFKTAANQVKKSSRLGSISIPIINTAKPNTIQSVDEIADADK